MQLNIPTRPSRHKAHSSRLNYSYQGDDSSFIENLGQYENEQRMLKEQYKKELIQEYQSIQQMKPKRKYIAQLKPSYVPQQRIDNQLYRRDQQREEFLKQIQDYELNKKLFDKDNKTESNQGFGNYFPFGRPGAGAPLRDSEGRIIANRISANSFQTGKKNLSTSVLQWQQYKEQDFYGKQEASQQKIRQEHYKALQDQIKIKKQKEQEEKRQRQQEEYIEEQRIQRELQELKDAYEREEQMKENGDDNTKTQKMNQENYTQIKPSKRNMKLYGSTQNFKEEFKNNHYVKRTQSSQSIPNIENQLQKIQEAIQSETKGLQKQMNYLQVSYYIRSKLYNRMSTDFQFSNSSQNMNSRKEIMKTLPINWSIQNKNLHSKKFLNKAIARLIDQSLISSNFRKMNYKPNNYYFQNKII